VAVQYRLHPCSGEQDHVEWELHNSRSDTPSYGFLIFKQDGSGSNTGMGGGLWTTTDQWLKLEFHRGLDLPEFLRVHGARRVRVPREFQQLPTRTSTPAASGWILN